MQNSTNRGHSTVVQEGSLKSTQEQSILDELKEFRKFEMPGGLTFKYYPDKEGQFNLHWETAHSHGVVDKAELWAIAFLMADEEMRQKMIPVKLEEKRVFLKTQIIRLTRDMKAGSFLKTTFKFTVPLEALVKVGGNGILVPKK